MARRACGGAVRTEDVERDASFLPPSQLCPGYDGLPEGVAITTRVLWRRFVVQPWAPAASSSSPAVVTLSVADEGGPMSGGRQSQGATSRPR